MKIGPEILEAILDAYPYEVVFADRTHTVRYMNKTAERRYGDRVLVGNSLFICHNEKTKPKIEAFLQRADNGEEEMFETLNNQTGEREFFTPVRDRNGKVIGYFERHEKPWDARNARVAVGDYWKNETCPETV